MVWIGFGLDVAWLRRCHVACGMEFKLLSFTFILDFALSEFGRFVVGAARHVKRKDPNAHVAIEEVLADIWMITRLSAERIRKPLNGHAT